MKELSGIVKELQELFMQEFQKFADNLFKFIDQFYDGYEPKYLQTLFEINSQEKIIEKYTKYGKDKAYSDKEMTKLLEM